MKWSLFRLAVGDEHQVAVGANHDVVGIRYNCESAGLSLRNMPPKLTGTGAGLYSSIQSGYSCGSLGSSKVRVLSAMISLTTTRSLRRFLRSTQHVDAAHVLAAHTITGLLVGNRHRIGNVRDLYIIARKTTIAQGRSRHEVTHSTACADLDTWLFSRQADKQLAIGVQIQAVYTSQLHV